LCACASAVAKDIVVAQVAAFTGAQAVSGKAIRAGLKLYLDHINKSGGIGGDKIKLLTYDDGYKADETVRIVKEVLAKETPTAFVGVLGTANCEALVKDGTLAKSGVPLIGAISGASSLVGAPGIFVTKASYRDEVKRLFQLLSGIGVNQVAVVYQNDGFGKDILSGAEIAAPQTGIKLVAKSAYERNTIKVEDSVKQVLASNAQAVYLGAVTTAAAAFVKEYRQAGGTAQIYGVSVVDVDSLRKALGPELVAGYGFGVLWPLTTSREFPIIREYQKLSAEAKDPDLAERSMEGFIAAKVLVQGLRQSRANPAALARAVNGMKGVDLGGFYVDFTQPERTGSQYVEFAIVGKGGQIHR
jgi:ABC-type branched-subunit amino acid transport system substrate-binding protein